MDPIHLVEPIRVQEINSGGSFTNLNNLGGDNPMKNAIFLQCGQRILESELELFMAFGDKKL